MAVLQKEGSREEEKYSLQGACSVPCEPKFPAESTAGEG